MGHRVREREVIGEGARQRRWEGEREPRKHRLGEREGEGEREPDRDEARHLQARATKKGWEGVTVKF